MKKIVIYALEGCANCKNVTEKVEELAVGKDIQISKKFCGAVDKACDAIENGLGTTHYPIVFFYGFDYFKDKFNLVNGVLYISSNAEQLKTPITFSADTIAEGFFDKFSLLSKLTQII